ncbi:MAG: response regulator [Sphingobacteriaceae bacterium]
MNTKPKVLFVDDDLLLVKAVELITRNTPYEFHLTTSVKEARQLLRSQAFQIIFSDYHMPDCNGVDFLAEAAVFCPGSVRILVSASLRDDLARQSLKQKHIFNFLKKPFGKDNFNNSLAEALEVWENQKN